MLILCLYFVLTQQKCLSDQMNWKWYQFPYSKWSIVKQRIYTKMVDWITFRLGQHQVLFCLIFHFILFGQHEINATMIHSLVFSSFLISSVHFMKDSTEDPGFSIKMNKFYLWKFDAIKWCHHISLNTAKMWWKYNEWMNEWMSGIRKLEIRQDITQAHHCDCTDSRCKWEAATVQVICPRSPWLL